MFPNGNKEFMKPTPEQELAILRLAKHYNTTKRPPAWHVKRDKLWQDITGPFSEQFGKATNDWMLVVEKITGNHSRDLKSFSKNQAIYKTHIKRLQDQCKVLGEVLAEERTLRKKAYAWYQKRLRSSFWGVIDMLTFNVRSVYDK